MLVERLRKDWHAREQALPINYAPSFTHDGLVMGAGTVLVPAVKERCLQALVGEEVRLLALLSAAYGRRVPSTVFGSIERAAKRWEQGEDCLASIHLALAGLSQPEDRREAARRLFMADGLIKAGIAPETILQGLGTDDGSFVRYSSLQPRVPGGNGAASGEWTKGGGVLRTLTQAAEQFLKRIIATQMAAALRGLERNPYILAAGLILLPKMADPWVEGDVQEIPGLRYSWNSDETLLHLTYTGPNGRRSISAERLAGGLFYDGDKVVARLLADGTVAVDPAEVSSDLADKDGPNLCPTPEPDKYGRGPVDGEKDKDYEDQIKLLVNPDNPTPRGYGYRFWDPERNAWVYIDDCQHRTGMRVEIKGDYDWAFGNDWGPGSIKKDWLNQSGNQLNVSKGFELRWVFSRQDAADFASTIFNEEESGERKRIGIDVVPRLGGTH